MKDFTYILVLVFYTHFFYSQDYNSSENRIYFSEQIISYLSEYAYEISKAEAAEDYLKVAELYKEFIERKLIGSYLDHFKVDCLGCKKNNLKDFKKPIVIFSYASWCGPLKDEISIFNRKVKKYKAEIDFLVLIWDSKKHVRKISKHFDRNAYILYVNEHTNRDNYTISMLKHALSVPTIIVTNSSKQIKVVLKPTPTFPNLVEHNFDQDFENSIQMIASY